MTEERLGLQGKAVLVTGGSGFIGAKLLKALLNLDANVIALIDDKCRLSRIESLCGDPRLRLVRCRITDADALTTQVERWGNIDLLAHLGIQVPSTANFCEEAIEDITMNLLPTLDLVKTLGNSLSGICFASSVAVYGRPTHLPVREDSLPCPIDSYAATKLATEHYLSAYGRSMHVPVTILRYSTVYGPGEIAHRAIPRFLRSLSEGQPPLINGDGSEKRDYVYVDDVVEATIQALVRKPDGAFNIGSGQGHSTLQVAQQLIRLCSANVEPLFLPRSRDNRDVICDISAASNALGYFPRTSLEDGLRQEIECYEKEVLHKLLALSVRRRRST
jgi:UDP-glucose 4-epimerase